MLHPAAGLLPWRWFYSTLLLLLEEADWRAEGAWNISSSVLCLGLTPPLRWTLSTSEKFHITYKNKRRQSFLWQQGLFRRAGIFGTQNNFVTNPSYQIPEAHHSLLNIKTARGATYVTLMYPEVIPLQRAATNVLHGWVFSSIAISISWWSPTPVAEQSYSSCQKNSNLISNPCS